MKQELFVCREPNQGDFLRVTSRRFKKDAIRVGTWKLNDGRELKVTRARMDGWIDRFKGMRAAGVQVSFPVDHSRDSEANRGWVQDLHREGDRLFAVVEVPLEEHARQLGTTIREVSISVVPNFTDGTGKNWGEVIRHIAPCTDPVVAGQGNFVPLDASDKDTEVFHLRKEADPMDWRKSLAKALNLSESEAGALSDDELVARIETMAESETKHTELLRQAKDGRDSAFARSRELEQQVAELREKAPDAPADETPREKELRLRVERLTRDGAEAKVVSLRAEGKVTPAMEPIVRELLAARDMNLRVGDADTDVGAQVEKLFASMPKGAALDMSERTKLTAEPNPNDSGNDGMSEAEQRKLGAASAARAQGRKPEAD